jgi:toxin HigB-1
MINDAKDIVHEGLRLFWESGGTNTSGIQADHAKRLRVLLVHLDSARNLNDIAEGLGKIKHFHPLTGHDSRYALDVNGPYRITFDCINKSTGEVTLIDYENYHGRKKS